MVENGGFLSSQVDVIGVSINRCWVMFIALAGKFWFVWLTGTLVFGTSSTTVLLQAPLLEAASSVQLTPSPAELGFYFVVLPDVWDGVLTFC